MVENPAEFTTLKTKLDLNEGTLSVHLRKLREAGYVEIEKTYKGTRPLTRVHLLPKGRRGAVSLTATRLHQTHFTPDRHASGHERLPLGQSGRASFLVGLSID